MILNDLQDKKKSSRHLQTKWFLRVINTSISITETRSSLLLVIPIFRCNTHTNKQHQVKSWTIYVQNINGKHFIVIQNESNTSFNVKMKIQNSNLIRIIIIISVITTMGMLDSISIMQRIPQISNTRTAGSLQFNLADAE